jgi:hypothetical protein
MDNPHLRDSYDMSQQGRAMVPVQSIDTRDDVREKTEKGQQRRFFEHVQPTFTVVVPKTTRLEFLDERNPAKSIIVRKKAREWVNQNRASTQKSRSRRRPSKAKQRERDIDSSENQDTRLERRSINGTVESSSPLRTIGLHQFDPFAVLPHVATNYDHLLDYCKYRSSPIRRLTPIMSL